MKTYKDLSALPTFKERFLYLKLNGVVGKDTFGFDRIFNQRFYSSPEWKRVRNEVIIRDNGCDLGIEGFDIYGRIIIHHINPITLADIDNHSKILLDPDNLICVSYDTHNAIHYGDESLLVIAPVERKKNDTCPWRH